MTDSKLNSFGAYIFESDECPCYPCRVSLIDAKVGERVLAINHEHLAVNTPYKSAGPIFVRKDANVANLSVNEVPQMLRHRMLSVRGYNNDNLMIKANTVIGEELENILTEQFTDKTVNLVQIHNAGPGCFNCSVVRA